ncbi:hypothetical protein Tco_0898781 [Tanacetum coccineum]
MWNCAMKFALRNKNKLDFIDGTCKRDSNNHVMANQWDMCNSMVVTWILGSLSPELYFLMGLDDAYLPIRSNILTRDPLPHVKTAFAVISEEESHRSIASMRTSPKPSTTAFCTNCNKTGHTVDRCYGIIRYPPSYVKRNNDFQGKTISSFNSTSMSNITNSTAGPSNPSMALINEQMFKLISLLNEKYVPTTNANMAATSFKDMALPPRDQRHQYLSYKGLQYTNADIVDFKTRLIRIYKREVHRVQVFDFEGLSGLIAEGLSTRMLMEHRDAQEGDTRGVTEEALVAPRGGDEDEEMPQETDITQKDEKQSQNDKTKHGMEKCEKTK